MDDNMTNPMMDDTRENADGMMAAERGCGCCKCCTCTDGCDCKNDTM